MIDCRNTGDYVILPEHVGRICGLTGVAPVRRQPIGLSEFSRLQGLGMV